MSKHKSPNRHPPDLLFELRLAQKSERWQVRTTLMGVPGELVGDGYVLRARKGDSVFIQIHLSLGFLLELLTTGPFTTLPDQAVAAVRQ